MRIPIPKDIQRGIEQLAQRELVLACYRFPQKLSFEDRKAFRKLLIARIKQQDYYKKNQKLMDLKPLLKPGFRPEQALMALSISHSQNQAFFVFTFKKREEEKLSLGIDIEESKRVSKALVARVSKKSEYLQSPSPSLLWTAKEASFKCFSKQALLLRECQISHWKKPNPAFDKCHLKHRHPLLANKNSYHFEASHKTQKAKGIAFLWNNMSLAYSQTKL